MCSRSNKNPICSASVDDLSRLDVRSGTISRVHPICNDLTAGSSNAKSSRMPRFSGCGWGENSDSITDFCAISS